MLPSFLIFQRELASYIMTVKPASRLLEGTFDGSMIAGGRLISMIKVSKMPSEELSELSVKDSGARFAISQRVRNNESTRNAAGVVLREYLELVNRRDYAEAKKVALGFSTEESKEAESITKRPSLMEAFLSLKHISGLWTTLKGGLWRSGERGNDPVCLAL
jgi:hypothetical protein